SAMIAHPATPEIAAAPYVARPRRRHARHAAWRPAPASRAPPRHGRYVKRSAATWGPYWINPDVGARSARYEIQAASPAGQRRRAHTSEPVISMTTPALPTAGSAPSGRTWSIGERPRGSRVLHRGEQTQKSPAST